MIEETKGRAWDCPESKVGCKRAVSVEKKARSPFSPSKKLRIAFSSVLNYCPECACVCVCVCACAHACTPIQIKLLRIDIEPVPWASQGGSVHTEYNGSAFSGVVQ